jgi:putative ABC transport system permease protein
MTLEELVSNLRYAVRSLSKSRGFTLIAVVSLALGIGANAALFSLVDALLLRTLPVRNPEQLVNIRRTDPARGKDQPINGDSVAALQAQRTVFAGVTGYRSIEGALVTVGKALEPNRLVVEAPPNFFTVIGVDAQIGRVDGDVAAAIISDRLWNRRFNRNASVIGRVLNVNQQSYPIVGVAPRGFLGMSLDGSVDVWLLEPGLAERPLSTVGRLQPGISLTQAMSATDARFRQIEDERGDQGEGRGTLITPAGKGFSTLRGQYGVSLQALMALVVLVLLLACSNIGSLMVVRNTSRIRELAVRTALGASRMRLLTQLLVESSVLALLGGVVVMIAVAIAACVIPAIRATQTDPLDAIRSE